MSPPADTTYDARPIDSAVQPCSSCHWFSIELAPCPDKAPRKPWWPTRREKSYPSESMQISLAGVGPKQTLDGSGKFSKSGLPAGDATLKFDRFHADIESAIAKGRHF